MVTKNSASTTRVLLVDDSPLVRLMLKDIFADGGDIVVAGEAGNGREAVALAESLRPDLIVMDIVMPVMDGLEAIEEIMDRFPTPILVLSGTLTDRDVDMSFAAIKRGALDVVEKPQEGPFRDLRAFGGELRDKVRMLARVKVIRHAPRRRRVVEPTVILPGGKEKNILAIGASTGGPRAVMSIVRDLPGDFRGAVCIVQHIAAGFTSGFAQWLDRESRLRVRLARDGDALRLGEVLVAPDDMHLTVEDGRAHLVYGPQINCCRPSIDVLFKSLAADRGGEVVGVLLTGMGRDGAAGLRSIREQGGATIVQDEESSVVFGMPKAAIALGAAERVVPLSAIPGVITRIFS